MANLIDFDNLQHTAETTKRYIDGKLQNVESTPGPKGEPGTPGKDGTTPTLEIGTTETLNAGENAAVEMTKGDGEKYTLKFKIPKGEQGIKGDEGSPGEPGKAGEDGQPGKDGVTPKLTLGEVTTGEPGSKAEATLTPGDDNTYTLGLKIPKGDQGVEGQAGADGAPGQQGAPGQDGQTPSFTIGEITTVGSDEGADVTITGEAPDYTLAFKIPKGDTGEQGATGAQGAEGAKGEDGKDGVTPTFSIGEVESVDSTAEVEVTTDGSADNAYQLNFKIPKGEAGAPGDQGIQGPKGDDGVTPTLKMGDVTTVESTVGASATLEKGATDNEYTLKLSIPKGVQGETGLQGVPGDQGPKGDTPTLTMGTVTTVDSETEADASLTQGDAENEYKLDLSIPKGIQGERGQQGGTGPQGPTGKTPTIAIGDITTVTDGSTADVKIEATPNEDGTKYTFDFVIPKGDKGDPGNPATNTTYELESGTTSGGATLTLKGSDEQSETITIKGSDATTVSQSGNIITISSTDHNDNTNTTYTMSAADGSSNDATITLQPSSGKSNVITLKGGGATSVSADSSGNVTISSTDTTYNLGDYAKKTDLSSYATDAELSNELAKKANTTHSHSTLTIQQNSKAETTYNGSSATTINITADGIGAAAASHKHNYSELSGTPTTMKNPQSLTIKQNGGSSTVYDGSSGQSVDITASNVGAFEYHPSAVTDLNAIRKAGLYNFSGNITQTGLPNGTSGLLLVSDALQNGSWQTQYFFPSGDIHAVYKRSTSGTAGTYGAWNKINIHDSELSDTSTNGVQNSAVSAALEDVLHEKEVDSSTIDKTIKPGFYRSYSEVEITYHIPGEIESGVGASQTHSAKIHSLIVIDAEVKRLYQIGFTNHVENSTDGKYVDTNLIVVRTGDTLVEDEDGSGKVASWENWYAVNRGTVNSSVKVVGTSRAGHTVSMCDFLCDGRNDHEVINKAIAALPESGGKIVILSGEYFLGGSIDPGGKPIWIQGCGSGTRLCLAKPMTAIFCSSSYGSSTIKLTELKVSDLTICSNTSLVSYLVEGSYKNGIFENVTFSASYTIPSNLGYTGTTYTYSHLVCPPSFFFPCWDIYNAYEVGYTLLDCVIATDAAFTFSIDNSVVRNMTVIGATNGANVSQVFNVTDADVEIHAPYSRNAITVNLKGNARGVKSPTCNVTISSGTDNVIA